MKKQTTTFSIRLDNEMLDSIKLIAEKERRSVNFIIVEILEESFSKNKNNVKINGSVLKEIKAYSKKANMTVSDVIEQLWKTVSKTYKR
jgi:hypothetical protein